MREYHRVEKKCRECGTIRNSADERTAMSRESTVKKVASERVNDLVEKENK